MRAGRLRSTDFGWTGIGIASVVDRTRIRFLLDVLRLLLVLLGCCRGIRARAGGTPPLAGLVLGFLLRRLGCGRVDQVDRAVAVDGRQEVARRAIGEPRDLAAR